MPNLDQILSLIRAILLSAGSILTVHGVALFSSDQWNSVVGGVMALIAVGWSLVTHATPKP